MSRRNRNYDEDDDRTHIAARQGDDCDMPVCESASDFKNAFNMTSTPKNDKNHNCPLNKEELGRNTWSFLHTMAAYYPDKPTEQEKTSMNQLITSFSQFYPCKPCAKDFREDLTYFPVEENTNSRIDLSKYFCMLHNRVSTKLGKENRDISQYISNVLGRSPFVSHCFNSM